MVPLVKDTICVWSQVFLLSRSILSSSSVLFVERKANGFPPQQSELGHSQSEHDMHVRLAQSALGPLLASPVPLPLFFLCLFRTCLQRMLNLQ